VGRLNMPTALEREGDYSQTFELNGTLTPVRDPLNNKYSSRNVIPGAESTRRDRLFSSCSLAQQLRPARTSHRLQSAVDHPRRDEILRLD